MRRTTLFRDELTSSPNEDWLGKIKIASPISHRVWAASAIALFILIIVWLSFGTYTRRERASGRVVPIGGIVKLKARASGEVMDVRFSEGDFVRAGDVIAIIDSDKFSKAPGGLGELVGTALSSQTESLDAEERRIRAVSRQQAREIARQSSSLSEQIEQGRKQLIVYQEEFSGQQAQLNKFESVLSQGYISGLQVQQQRTAVAIAMSNVIRQKGQIASFWQQKSELNEKLAQSALEKDRQLASIGRQRSVISIEATKNTSDSSNVIRAPYSGTISTLLAYRGQSVTAGTPVVSIAPLRAPFEVELFIDSVAVGFVRKGQKVAVR